MGQKPKENPVNAPKYTEKRKNVRKHGTKVDAEQQQAEKSGKPGKFRYEVVEGSAKFGQNRLHETVQRGGLELQRWETKKHLQGKSVWKEKKWNEKLQKFEYTVDLRPFKDLPEHEKLWHKHTNSARYRQWKRMGHDDIMREVNRVRERTKMEFGTLKHGTVLHEKIENILTEAQRNQLLAHYQDNPDTSLDAIASQFMVPVEYVKWIIIDKKSEAGAHHNIDSASIFAPKNVYKDTQTDHRSVRPAYESADEEDISALSDDESSPENSRKMEHPDLNSDREIPENHGT